jgi:hypothetical protein
MTVFDLCFSHRRSTGLLPALLLLAPLHAVVGQRAINMPDGRLVEAGERTQLEQILRRRYADTVAPGARYRAAGPFRTVTTRGGFYLDRTDLGSFIYFRPAYGRDSATLDSTKTTREALLKRIDSLISIVAPTATGRRFLRFQDHFVGSVDLKDSATLNARTAGRLVARTAVFERLIDSIPVFGSELRIGLTREGSVGELRVHWPVIDARTIAEARDLRASVASERWSLPLGMRGPAIKVESVVAGIVHTGIAQPGFFAAPVVRVFFRPVARDTVLNLSRPRVRYFDSRGLEVKLPVVPHVARTPRSKKTVPKPQERTRQP